MRDRTMCVTAAPRAIAAAVLLLCAGTGWAQDAPVAAAASTKTMPSNEQMRHFRRIGGPRLSPDGKHVLVQVQDATADGGKSHLWLIDAGGGAPRQLTYSPDGDKRGERAAEWMPDGESVLFLAHRGEHTALYRLPMAGGEAELLDLKVAPVVDESKRADAIPPPAADKDKPGTDRDRPAAEKAAEPVAIDVEGYRIAPDGRTVAVWAQDPQTAGEKSEKDAKADAQWVDHDGHGSRLYLLDVTAKTGTAETTATAAKTGAAANKPGAAAKLTAVGVRPDVRHCAWSPDSRRLVVLAEGMNDVSDLAPAMSAWMVELSDPAHPVQIEAIGATVETVTWSADGQSVFYLAQAKQDAPPGYVDLYAYNVGSKATADLSEGFRGSIAAQEILAGAKSGGPWVLAEVGVQGVLASFAPGGGREPQAVIGLATGSSPSPAVRDANTNAAESAWVFLGSGGERAEALYLRSGGVDAEPRVLKTPAMLPDGVAVGAAAKRVQWKNEGQTVDGLLYLPAEASTTHRVPLIVEVHGGPLGAYLDAYDPFADFLRGHGWAVLRTNPRGSTGRGAGFAAANHNDLGGADFRDVMAGVDAVLKTEPLDGERMALMGYSYGGEMAGFAEGKTTRFRAIVSGAPVIDQASEYGTESGSWYDRWYFGKPWERSADAWRQSPLAGVVHAKTPFLLLQGESDSTDPLGQSQEMYRALRQQGVPVDLVTYPREDHGPLAMGIYGRPTAEPWHGFDARQRIVAFLERNFAAAPQK